MAGVCLELELPNSLYLGRSCLWPCNQGICSRLMSLTVILILTAGNNPREGMGAIIQH